MKNFKFIKRGLNTETLLKAINGKPYIWDEIKLRQNTEGSPHKDTKTIFIRWSKSFDVDSAFNDLVAIDYPNRTKLTGLNQLIDEVLYYGKSTDLGRVLITCLKPGGKIEAHCDEGNVCANYERFHIPLLSESGNRFFCENEHVSMNAGELWCFNNKKHHWVENESKSDRIHLIVDAVSKPMRQYLNGIQ